MKLSTIINNSSDNSSSVNVIGLSTIFPNPCDNLTDFISNNGLVGQSAEYLSFENVAIFHVAQGPFIEEFPQCVTHGFYTEPWQEQLYASFSLFFMFLLPLVILITTYVSTVITISRSQKMFKAEPTTGTYIRNSDLNRRRLMHRAKTKSLRISVVIVAAFLIWWTPYYTMMIIFLFLDPDEHLSEELQSGIFFFGMSNSLVNPLIYGAFHLWPQKQRQGSYQR
ncbi:Gonadotropin-releasing hormone II receptor [Camponotus floridanus]|uniref:Gonadotropin-releasing hormone II receptor n=1 Tax=Camponotus floridanus TaxID=104421 RepID=E2ABD5_CAMFO|nr:Gonadotropin-releasing hormone II receptor [Camponotus floridanus]